MTASQQRPLTGRGTRSRAARSDRPASPRGTTGMPRQPASRWSIPRLSRWTSAPALLPCQDTDVSSSAQRLWRAARDDHGGPRPAPGPGAAGVAGRRGRRRPGDGGFALPECAGAPRTAVRKLVPLVNAPRLARSLPLGRPWDAARAEALDALTVGPGLRGHTHVGGAARHGRDGYRRARDRPARRVDARVPRARALGQRALAAKRRRGRAQEWARSRQHGADRGAAGRRARGNVRGEGACGSFAAGRRRHRARYGLGIGESAPRDRRNGPPPSSRASASSRDCPHATASFAGDRGWAPASRSMLAARGPSGATPALAGRP